jgi:hypothetical protein
MCGIRRFSDCPSGNLSKPAKIRSSPRLYTWGEGGFLTRGWMDVLADLGRRLKPIKQHLPGMGVDVIFSHHIPIYLVGKGLSGGRFPPSDSSISGSGGPNLKYCSVTARKRQWLAGEASAHRNDSSIVTSMLLRRFSTTTTIVGTDRRRGKTHMPPDLSSLSMRVLSSSIHLPVYIHFLRIILTRAARSLTLPAVRASRYSISRSFLLVSCSQPELRWEGLRRPPPTCSPRRSLSSSLPARQRPRCRLRTG